MSTSSVLIVDDDPDFVAATQAILEREQYKVISAYDGDGGFAKLHEETPDVVILDVMMGRRAEGFVFARKMRRDPRFDRIPILMVTGMSEQTGFRIPGGPIHPKFLPVDEYIEKPIEPQDLLTRIGHRLAMRDADRAQRSLVPAEEHN